jgi:hypothetical protein
VGSTSGTDSLSVRVTLAAGGQAVGPISETWKVAPGLLQGTVYYESYLTQLVTNSQFSLADGGTIDIGAALLAIKPGDLAPHVVAGTNSPGLDAGNPNWGVGCRGCHSVAAKGGSFLIQQNDYSITSLYSLPSATETQLPIDKSDSGQEISYLAFAGLSPDGTLALTNTAGFPAVNPEAQIDLYTIGANPTLARPSGLPAGVQGATPVFSPDGTHVAFTHTGGTLGSLVGDGSHVVALESCSRAAAGTAPLRRSRRMPATRGEASFRSIPTPR